MALITFLLNQDLLPLAILVMSWLRGFATAILLSVVPIIFNYAFAWVAYHWQHRNVNERQIPPGYPSFIPYLGSFLSLVWNGEQFLRRATYVSFRQPHISDLNAENISSYAGKLTAARVTVLGTEVYLFQDYASIRSIWKHQLLASPMTAYVYTLKYICGQDSESLAIYRADDSGPFPKPHPGTNVSPHNRVDYITHAGLLRGLTGRGLAPTTTRLSSILDKACAPTLFEEWTEMPDLLQFFQRNIGTSIMQSLFGPTLLRLHPTFVDDFWEYEKNVPRFAWGLPSFMMPGAYRNRRKLINQLTSWYAFARRSFTESSRDEDGDGDVFWGSELMRSRQRDLLGVDGQSDESLASADLGLIWA